MAAYQEWSDPGQPYAFMAVDEDELTPEQVAQREALEQAKQAGLNVAQRLNIALPEIPDGAFVADGLIPADLAARLEARLDALAAACDDYHPGSNGRVLDLIHPSLYCYVKGLSRLANDEVEPWVASLPGDNSVSRYSWLPAEVDVPQEAGNPRFASYVNGLDSADDADLLADVAETFGHFLPLLERAANYRLADGLEDGDAFDSAYLDGPRPLPGSLRGKRLQVIVKAVDYVLKSPGEQHAGVWHVEGMPQEAIVASGIYYVSATPNMAGQGLQFRRPVSQAEAEELMMALQQYEEPYYGANCTIELSTVRTPPGRCLAFTNDLQHKLATLTNTSPTVPETSKGNASSTSSSATTLDTNAGGSAVAAPSAVAQVPPSAANAAAPSKASGGQAARRRILCFFLVDPNRRIVSTADVPDQRRDKWVLRAQAALRESVGAATGIPDVAVNSIAASAAVGFTLEEAKEHRLGLMRDRSVMKDALNNEYARDLNLCEH